MGHMACTEPQCLYKGNLYLYLLTCILTTQCLINSEVNFNLVCNLHRNFKVILMHLF